MKRLNTYNFVPVLLFLTFVTIVLFFSKSKPEENINPKQRTTLSTKQQNFPVWKTIELGSYENNDAIRKALVSEGFIIENWASDILRRTPVGNKKNKLDLILISAGQLGFKDQVTYKDIYERAQKRGLKFLPAETGPQLRLRYKDQPKNEWLHIGMEPILDSTGDPTIFDVMHNDGHAHDDHDTHSHHSLQLCSSSVRSDVLWSPSSLWVFAY